jgi:hypothetical protein
VRRPPSTIHCSWRVEPRISKTEARDQGDGTTVKLAGHESPTRTRTRPDGHLVAVVREDLFADCLWEGLSPTAIRHKALPVKKRLKYLHRGYSIYWTLRQFPGHLFLASPPDAPTRYWIWWGRLRDSPKERVSQASRIREPPKATVGPILSEIAGFLPGPHSRQTRRLGPVRPA